MSFVRSKLAYVIIDERGTRGRGAWSARAYDEKGWLRSEVHGDPDYVKRKIAEFWPDLPVYAYSKENQGAGELVLAEVVLYGLVLGTLGIVGYALYNAIKNATAPGAAQSVAAGAGVAELGPGGSQQTIGAAAGTLGPAASVQAPAGSLEQPETS